MSEQPQTDLLHGYSAIASFLGVRPRQAEYWASSAGLPVFKVGRTVCARRSALTAWLAEQEAKGLAAIRTTIGG